MGRRAPLHDASRCVRLRRQQVHLPEELRWRAAARPRPALLLFTDGSSHRPHVYSAASVALTCPCLSLSPSSSPGSHRFFCESEKDYTLYIEVEIEDEGEAAFDLSLPDLLRDVVDERDHAHRELERCQALLATARREAEHASAELMKENDFMLHMMKKAAVAHLLDNETISRIRAERNELRVDVMILAANDEMSDAEITRLNFGYNDLQLDHAKTLRGRNNKLRLIIAEKEQIKKQMEKILDSQKVRSNSQK